MDKYQYMPGSINVVIAGGGTGGHVFPAIAIARALKAKALNVNILFVGAKGRMEMQKVPQAGFRIVGLNIAGIQRRLTWKNLLVPFKVIDSMIRAKAIIRQFRPDVVIGVGGYASGPVVRAASQKGIPTLIQEQNSFPGLTNRMLAKKAGKICVAYEGMERYFEKSKIILTGNPVRQDIVHLEGKYGQAMKFFGLSAERPVLLVTGGSLGARTINESVSASLELMAGQGIQIVWQTGTSYYREALRQVEKQNIKGVCVFEFIDRMDFAYAAADLIVSRAGAIAVSEICAVQKPAILIPSPNVAEDHQTKNAKALADKQAALLIKDSEAAGRLGQAVIDLINDEEKKHRLKARIASLSYRDAADAIAGIAIGLVNPGKPGLSPGAAGDRSEA